MGEGGGGDKRRRVRLTAFHRLFLMPKNMKPPEALVGSLAAAALGWDAGFLGYDAMARVPKER